MSQKNSQNKRRTWWVDLPVAVGIVAGIAVYSRHYSSYRQGQLLVAVAVATITLIIALGLVFRRRNGQQPQARRSPGGRWS
jgi:hypothetical protein